MKKCSVFSHIYFHMQIQPLLTLPIKSEKGMALILGGNSEIGAYVRRILCQLICFKAFVSIERSHKSDFFLRKTYLFFSSCATCFELPSNVSIMGKCNFKPWDLITFRHVPSSGYLVFWIQVQLNAQFLDAGPGIRIFKTCPFFSPRFGSTFVSTIFKSTINQWIKRHLRVPEKG